MNITMIGSGYVGLTTGLGLAREGHSITFVDTCPQRIAALKAGHMPLHEEGLGDLLKKYNKTLTFTTHVQDSWSTTDMVMIAVGTPSQRDGATDLTALRNFLTQVRTLPGKMCIVKSTVPMNTMETLWHDFQMSQWVRPDQWIHVPEFLREGTALHDFLHPQRIVIGMHKEASVPESLYHLYRPLKGKIIATSWTTAEMVKYVSNGFLALKVTYANEMARLAQETGACILDVLQAAGEDTRIGTDFFMPGPGFGGSCLPKDVRSLNHRADSLHVDLPVTRHIMHSNQVHQDTWVQAIRQVLPRGPVALLGAAFKAFTNDYRESPALALAQAFAQVYPDVRIYDPVCDLHDMAPITVASSWEEAVCGAQGCVILTEWPVFASLTATQLTQAGFQGNVIGDTRYMTHAAHFPQWHYIALGQGSAGQSETRHSA